MLNKNDFIELEYVGKANEKIFDTNIKEEAKKINLDVEFSPSIICLGQGMILKAIDDFLMGKELRKYILELAPEKAFGLRQPTLVKTIPINIFKGQDIMPQPGMVFTFDNMLGKISAVSGGRVIVDFNNPLAGKNVVYELDVKKKVDNLDEKVSSLCLFFFRQKIDFEIKQDKLVLKIDKNLIKFASIFKDKFKEILNLELEAVEKAEEKSSEKSQ